MEQDAQARTRQTVQRLRQSSAAFRWLSIASGIGAVAAMFAAVIADADVTSPSRGAMDFGLVVYAIVGTIGCYATHAALDGLAAVVELLAERAG